MNTQDLYDSVQIVMVNTTLPVNIGSAARAIKTMGFKRLVLVHPQTFPSGDASAVASGAADILEHAVCCDTLEQAVSQSRLVLGTSARSRSMPWPLLVPDAAASLVKNFLLQQPGLPAAGPFAPVSFVFGREDRGLTNEELALCNYHVTIPGNPEYSVLNIAAAIQVFCYELRCHFEQTGLLRASTGQDPHQLNIILRAEWDEPAATVEETHALLEHFRSLLVQLELVDPENPRLILQRMNRLVKRLQLDRPEYNFLRGVIAQTEKRLNRQAASKD